MIFLHGMLDWLGHAVLYGTVLAVLTAALVWLCGRRLPLWAHCLLWTIVLAKFLLPAWPHSPLSIEGVVVSTSSWINGVSAPQVGTAAPPSTLRDAIWLLLGREEAVATAEPAAAASWASWLALAYLAGLVLVACWRVRTIVRFRAACHNFPMANKHTLGFVTDLCRGCGCKRSIDVRVVDHKLSPFIFGLWRPTLVIPRELLSRPDELEAVVLHEVAHLRRGDMWVRQVQWFAGTVLFFWPVVAWVNRRLDLVREHACDVWAVERGRLTAGAYARCLLRASHGASPGLWASRTAAMAANPRTIERRIDMILEPPHRRSIRRATWPAVGLMGLWCVSTLTSAGAKDREAPAEEAVSSHVVIDLDTTTSDGDVDVDNIKEFNVLLAPMSGEWRADVTGEHLDGVLSEVHEFHVDGDTPHAIFVTRPGVTADGTLSMTLQHHGECLKKFLEDNPAADADADGTVSRTEHDAFLVAVAQSDPHAVMEAFPHADRDDDGTLSGQETAHLVGSGPFMQHLHGTGDHWVTHPEPEDADVRRARVQVRSGSTTAEAHFEVVELAQLPQLPLEPIAQWLLENIDYRPVAAEVAEWVEVVERAPMTAMLERHPEADADEDGALSAEELETFLRDELGVHMMHHDTQSGQYLDIMHIKGANVTIEANVIEFIGEDGATITLDGSGESVWIDKDDE